MVFSRQLYENVTGSYPWDLLHQVGWIVDLGGLFFQWLQRAQIQYVEPRRATTLQLVPAVFMAYVTRDYPHLEREWLWVLECAVQDIDQITAICSFEPRPDTVKLIGTNLDLDQDVQLLRNEADWRDLIESRDPWLRHQLPREGECPYVPDSSWSDIPGDFPRRLCRPRDQVGFLDEQGRIWLKHIERGQIHWDVQCPPFGRELYFKVSPDGRLLEGSPC